MDELKLKALFGRVVLDFGEQLDASQKDALQQKYKKRGCLFFYDINHANSDPESAWKFISKNAEDSSTYISTIVVCTHPFEKDFQYPCRISEGEFEDLYKTTCVDKFTKNFYIVPKYRS